MSFHLQAPKMGIAELDEQHGRLIACLDRLQGWAGKGCGFPAALEALTTLNDYIADHFIYEEALLRQHDYPKLDEHIEEHRRIHAELCRLNQQVFDGGAVSDKLLRLVRTWVHSHIGVEDLEFAAFFGQRQHSD